MSQTEWDVINLLAERGGWDDLDMKKLGSSLKAGSSSKDKAAAPATKKGAKSTRRGKKRQLDDDAEMESPQGEAGNGDIEPVASKPATKAPPAKKSRRGKEPVDGEGDAGSVRRSSRCVVSKGTSS